MTTMESVHTGLLAPLPPSPRLRTLLTPILEPGSQGFVDLSYGADGGLQPETGRVWQFGLSLVQADAVGKTGERRRAPGGGDGDGWAGRGRAYAGCGFVGCSHVRRAGKTVRYRSVHR